MNLRHSSVFFNAGSVNINDTELTVAENASSTISNAGKIKVEELKIQEGDSNIMQHRNFMEVKQQKSIALEGPG
ncbi:MAG: hypothetical protein V8R04_13410 [Bacteroides thetaiotaomicron]